MKADYTSKDGRIKLYNMDFMDYLATCKENEFDLAVVDPPYGIGAAKRPVKAGKWRRDIHIKKEWDSCRPEKDYFIHLISCSNDQVIWGGNYFIDYLSATPCFVVWDKKLENGWLADCELAWTSFKTQTKKFTRHHIEDHNEGKTIRIHPTQKPVKLYDWIYKNYAEQGQRILDTHLGSGSSAIAAHYAGLEFVGIELDEDYFKAAVDRFEKETAQGDLFGKGAA